MSWKCFHIIFIIFILYVKNGDSEKCLLSKKCTESDRDFDNSIDSSDPCTDFFEHACGKWINKNPIPDFQESWDTYDVLKNQTIHRVKKILLEINRDDSEPLKKAKKFYEACLNMDNIKRRGISGLRNYLEKIGKWPILFSREKQNSIPQTWYTIHNKIYRSSGFASLFIIAPKMEKNSTNRTHILTIETPKKKFQMHGWEGNKNYTHDAILALSRGKIRNEDVMKDIDEIMKFGKKLTAITFRPRKISQEKGIISIEKLQQSWNQWIGTNQTGHMMVDWLHLITDIFNSTGVQITGNERILIRQIEFMKKLAELLSETHPRVITNYVMWAFVNEALQFTSFGANQAESNKIKGSTERWKFCIENQKVVHPIASQFVLTDARSNSTKNKCQTLVKYIRKIFKVIIAKSSGLNSVGSKMAAIDRVNKTSYYCGYPDWYENSTKIDSYYDELVVSGDYFTNMLEFERFELRKKLKSLRENVNDEESMWNRPITDLENLYNAEIDSIVIPAALINSILFRSEERSFLNYATLGTILGKELHLSFVRAMKFDNGNDNPPGFTAEDVEDFRREKNCFIEQYIDLSKFLNKSSDLISNTFVHQLMAETDGLSLSYEAFRNQRKRAKMIPNEEKERFYFVTFASRLCGMEKYEHYHTGRKFQFYPTNKMRINAAVMNFRPFADAFNCSLNSLMNPSRKCSVWYDGDN